MIISNYEKNVLTPHSFGHLALVLLFILKYLDSSSDVQIGPYKNRALAFNSIRYEGIDYPYCLLLLYPDAHGMTACQVFK